MSDQQQFDFSIPSPFAQLPYLKIKKSIRIAVSGDVHLTGLEQRIIDTPEFQRLRRIRQLGPAYFVFPTALHTRFDHSLGVLAMAQHMINSIRQNTHNVEEDSRIEPEQIAVARLYGLLHDITHIPFGHTIEDELGVFTRHDENKPRIEHFIGRDSTIGGLIADNLGEDIFLRFYQVFNWDSKPKDPKTRQPIPPQPLPNNDEFIYDLVSDTVCADLLDYLARDAYFCNLQIVPEYRFLKFLYLRNDGHGCRRPFIRLWKPQSKPRRDLLTDLSRLLDARYLLAERVYFHHTKIAAAAMLGRALNEAALLNELDEKDTWSLGDDELLEKLGKSESTIASTMAHRLKTRDLYKILDDSLDSVYFEEAQRKQPEINVQSAVFSKIKNNILHRKVENQLAGMLPVPEGDVLIYGLGPEDTNAKLADIHVLWEGTPLKLREIKQNSVTDRLQQTIKSHEELWGVRVIVDEKIRDDKGLRERLFKACVTELFYPDQAQQSIKESLRARVIQENIHVGMPAGEFDRLLDERATEIAAPAKSGSTDLSIADQIALVIEEIKSTSRDNRK